MAGAASNTPARSYDKKNMPRLLAINNYYYPRGGSETIFFEHNRMLEALGWEVIPFSMRHPANLPSPWSDYFIDDLEMHGDYSLAQKLTRLPKVIYSLRHASG